MMTLILGGSGSGKSFYAEHLLQPYAEDHERYYLATMKVYGEEGRRKVERHRLMRKDKGFVTIEQPESVSEAMKSIKTPEKSAVLLECISNLTANEMFSESGPNTVDVVVQKVIHDIAVLNGKLARLVLVSNNIFEDGILYEESTMDYIRAMGRINAELARMSDVVTEVVVGIPITVKERQLT